jgi:hypothetical protein
VDLPGAARAGSFGQCLVDERARRIGVVDAEEIDLLLRLPDQVEDVTGRARGKPFAGQERAVVALWPAGVLQDGEQALFFQDYSQ